MAYISAFRRPLLYFSIFVGLIVAWKFVPVVFMLTYTPPPIVVSAEEAVAENWNKELRAIGSIEAVRSVVISSEVAGLVTKIHFNSGDAIAEGASLIQLNDAAEQADFKRYTAQLSLASITADRTKKLTNRKVHSQASLDQSQAQLKETEALVNQAQAIIEKKNIRAPFGGILGIRQVNLGQYVAPGQAIVTLTDASQVYINFTRPEKDRKDLAVGQQVVAMVDAYPDKQFHGTLTTIDPQINRDTRTISLQATLDNPDLLLSSGMFADVTVILPQQQSIVVIPETSVDYSLYGSSVYVVAPDKKAKDVLIAERRYVKVGDRQKNKVSISGINPGDIIVSAGHAKLNHGAHVEISKDQTPLAPPNIPNH